MASSKPHKVSSGMEVCCVPPTLCSLRAAWVGGSLLPLYSPLAHMDGQTVTPAQLPPISPRPGRTHHPVMGPLHSLGCTGLAPPADSSPHQSTPSLIFTAIAAPGPDTGGATPTAGHQRDPNGGGGGGARPSLRPNRRGLASEKGRTTHRDPITGGSLSSSPSSPSTARGLRRTWPRDPRRRIPVGRGALKRGPTPEQSPGPRRDGAEPNRTKPSRDGDPSRTEPSRDGMGWGPEPNRDGAGAVRCNLGRALRCRYAMLGAPGARCSPCP